MTTNRLFPSHPGLSGISVSQRVSELLRTAIVQGAIKPNQRLLEESIAKELSVSRTPVREAIRRLEAEGLVEYVPQRGSVVRQVSSEEISQVYDIRVLLEGHAARLAAARIDQQGLLMLENLCQAFQAVIKDDSNPAGQVSRLMDLNNQFHSAIREMSGNKTLMRIFAVSLHVPQIYLVYYWYDYSNRVSSDQMHERILDAMKDKDAAKAEKLMREHLIAAKDLILKALDRINTSPVPQAE